MWWHFSFVFGESHSLLIFLLSQFCNTLSLPQYLPTTAFLEDVLLCLLFSTQNNFYIPFERKKVLATVYFYYLNTFIKCYKLVKKFSKIRCQIVSIFKECLLFVAATFRNVQQADKNIFRLIVLSVYSGVVCGSKKDKKENYCW